MEFTDRRGVTKIVHRKEKANPAAAHFIEQCLHLSDGSKFEIDQGGGVEKALEQGTAHGRVNPPRPPSAGWRAVRMRERAVAGSRARPRLTNREGRRAAARRDRAGAAGASP